jgi:hypothetical protein
VFQISLLFELVKGTTISDKKNTTAPKAREMNRTGWDILKTLNPDAFKAVTSLFFFIIQNRIMTDMSVAAGIIWTTTKGILYNK